MSGIEEQEQLEFRRLLIRVRKTVADIESLPNSTLSVETFREVLLGLHAQTSRFIGKHPEFKDEFESIPSDIFHKHPLTFQASIKSLRSFLDAVEDSITYETNLQPSTEFIILPGQAFTASKIIESILESATKSIKIVDNYMSEDSVQVIETANTNRDIQILTLKTDPKFITAVSQSKKGRKGLYEVRTTSSFHDRYLIIDDTDVWMCGPSIDYLGVKKPGVIVKFEDVKIISTVISLFNSEWQSASVII